MFAVSYSWKFLLNSENILLLIRKNIGKKITETLWAIGLRLILHFGHCSHVIMFSIQINYKLLTYELNIFQLHIIYVHENM